LFVMEAIWSRFLPAYEMLGELLAESAIGEIESVDAGQCERVAEVGEPVWHLEPVCAGRGLLGVTPDERVHLEPRRAQRAQVRDATEAGAHDHDAGHARLPGCRHGM
jgi:hypothetical protein